MRPIDADAIVSIQTFDEMHEEWAVETMSVAEALDSFSDEGCPPTLDVEPVRHGRWKDVGLGFMMLYVCTHCGKQALFQSIPYQYCPSCGAKMDAKENDDA